jgi:membrane fusion protein, heavy metal efflux system
MRVPRSPWSLTLLILLGAPGCGSSAANPTREDLPGGAVTAWTNATEVFMEHPALIAGQVGRFAIHLTGLGEFRPVESGRLTLRLRPAGGGEVLVVTQDAPRRPGIYGPDVEFPGPGLWHPTLLIAGPQVTDSIPLPPLRVAATPGEIEVAEPPPGTTIAFLKEQQWTTPGFATAVADTGRIARGIPAPGRLVPAAGRLAVVAAPIAGLLDADGLRRTPPPGRRVEAGQRLAVLTPTVGEGGAVIAAARAELREAEDEHQRVTRLVALEAVPERRVHEARIRLDAAREALAGLTEGTGRDAGRVEVRAPIGGVLVSRLVTPGARVAAGEPLFTIVDPAMLWLETPVPAGERAAIAEPSGAVFVVAGEAGERRAGRLISVGTVIDSLTRSVLVRFEVPNPAGDLAVGQLARVLVLGRDAEPGVILPVSAIVDDDNQPVAFVQVAGEAFERRALTLGPRLGGRVLVRSGIRRGERVVTGAAPVVRLASRSSALPTHGHEH